MKIVVAGYGQMLSNLVLGSQEAGHRVIGVLRYERTKYNPLILFFKDIFAPGTDFSFIPLPPYIVVLECAYPFTAPSVMPPTK